MLDILILNFPDEGTDNVFVSLSSFFDVFVFSYCCCAPVKDKHSKHSKPDLSQRKPTVALNEKFCHISK